MTRSAQLGRRLGFVALLCCAVLSDHGVAQEKAFPAKPLLKKKRKPQPLRPLNKEAVPTPNPSQFGVGVGLFNFLPPQPTIEGAWRYGQMVASAEFGVFGLNGSEFAASSSYIGIAGRYLFTPTFFAGLGIGKRHIVVTTQADLAVDDTKTPVRWTRTTDQMVATPKIGWESFADRTTSLLLSVGLLVPFGTRFETSRDVETVPDLSAEEMDEEEKKKGDDVRKFTAVAAPYFELKYAWFF